MIAESLETMATRGLLGGGANVALFVGSYWIARYGFRQPRGLSISLAAALIFWVASTIGAEVLGCFGVLSSAPMLAWGVAICAAGGIVRRFRGEGAPVQAAPLKVEPLAWDAVFSLSLLLSVSLVLGMRSLILGVKVVSDGPIYHLYFAARWWKAGGLFLVASPFGESAATYFPANGDLWFAWLMVSWGGELLAKVGQAPFLVLASVAAYGCARRLGAGRSAGVVATCWFATCSPLLLFSFEPNVDTIFVAGYLVAAYFFVQAWQSVRGTASWCLGAIAAGEALGTKVVGVVFVPPLLVLAAGAILVAPVASRTKILRISVVLLGTLFSGGFWYLRNALLTGNPLYPLEIRLLGHSLLRGWYLPEAMITSPYYVPFANWRALGDILLGVLDPRLTLFWIAALLVGCSIRAPRIDGSRHRVIAIFSIMTVLNVVLYWVCIPYRTQQRFMLQALGLAVVPLAVTLDQSRWLRRGAAVLVALHCLTPQAWPWALADGRPPWDLTPLIPNAVSDPVLFFARIARASQADESRRSALGLILLIGIILCAVVTVKILSRVLLVDSSASRLRWLLILGWATFFVSLGYLDVWRDSIDPRLRFYPAFPDFFAGWLQLESRSGASGARVAYSGTNIPYYLMAIGLRNEVRYVNIDRHRGWLLHDYHREAQKHGHGNWPNSRPGWDRMEPDYSAWIDNLDAERIQLLVVTRVNPAEGAHNVAGSDYFPIERRWADSHPERFEPLYGTRENDRWFRLYRLRRGRSNRSAVADRFVSRLLCGLNGRSEQFSKKFAAAARIMAADGTYKEYAASEVSSHFATRPSFLNSTGSRL